MADACTNTNSTPEQDDEVARWIEVFRSAGGHFQFFPHHPDTVFIGMPLGSPCGELEQALSGGLRPRIVEAAKALLQANGGFY